MLANSSAVGQGNSLLRIKTPPTAALPFKTLQQCSPTVQAAFWFIKGYIETHGHSPLYREIAEDCHIEISKIAEVLDILESDVRLIERPTRHKQRGIRLTGSAAAAKAAPDGYKAMLRDVLKAIDGLNSMDFNRRWAAQKVIANARKLLVQGQVQ